MNFYKKSLIFLAAAVCTVAFAGCSADENTVKCADIITETVQTECQPVSKSTDDTVVKVQTADIPVKTNSENVPKVIEIKNEIKNSTDDTPKKQQDTEVDKSKITSSKASSDTDSESKAKSTDTESDKSKTTSSKASSDTDFESKAKSTDTETKNSSDKDKSQTKTVTKTPPKEYQIKMKHITQFKDMPTGCEIVSARMVLEYYGKNITYEHMLSYMSKANLKMSKDGKLYGKTPYQAFLGDPKKSSGFGCYPPVIMEMVANYNYNDLYAESTCNLPLDFIAKTYLPQDIPVLVWATIGMGDSYLTDSWYVEGEDGKPTKQKYTWRAAEHCLVLTGYDDKYYYFSDPLSYQDVTKYEKPLVEKRYKEIGYNSMIIRRYE